MYLLFCSLPQFIHCLSYPLCKQGEPSPSSFQSHPQQECISKHPQYPLASLSELPDSLPVFWSLLPCPSLSVPSSSKVPSQFFASRHPSTASPWCHNINTSAFANLDFQPPTLSRAHSWPFCLCACLIPKGKLHHRSNTAERWTKGRNKIRLWDLGDHWWCAREHFYEMSREAILGSYVLSTSQKQLP